MRGLLLALVLAGCKADVGDECEYSFKCKSGFCVDHVCTSGELGAACNENYECPGPDKACVSHVCKPEPREGEACAKGSCATGLRCFEDVCRTPAAVTKLEQQLKVKEEARLLKASGVSDAPAAEIPTTEPAVQPPAGGLHVRVAKTTAKGTAFAACRSDERMIGGGCQLTARKERLASSYPSHYSEQDTVGARWNCDADEYKIYDVTAYALCEKVP